MKTPRLILSLSVVAGLMSLVSGCMSWHDLGLRSHSRKTERTSLMKFLYPTKETATQKPEIPTLTLPLRVGIAWVPQDTGSRTGFNAVNDPFTAEERHRLLENVSTNFTSHRFVRDIQIIPSTYVQPGGGFENLDQLRTMFGVDVIALVALDQTQFNTTTELSIFYWTIVGAYFVPAERGDTHTMLDTAVFDIPSRKLLFRAPGTSQLKGWSSAAYQEEDERGKRISGIRQASMNMVSNLQTELGSFQQRIKEQPESVRIVKSPGYVGGSTGGWLEVVLALAAGIALIISSRTKQA